MESREMPLPNTTAKNELSVPPPDIWPAQPPVEYAPPVPPEGWWEQTGDSAPGFDVAVDRPPYEVQVPPLPDDTQSGGNAP